MMSQGCRFDEGRHPEKLRDPGSSLSASTLTLASWEWSLGPPYGVAGQRPSPTTDRPRIDGGSSVTPPVSRILVAWNHRRLRHPLKIPPRSAQLGGTSHSHTWCRASQIKFSIPFRTQH